MMAHRIRAIAQGVALFVILVSVYMIFYRGHPLSIDEISLFDSVGSLVNHGTLARTTEFYRAPTINADGAPFLPPLYEPLHIAAASPFYLLAKSADGFGQFHTVFLLNIAVTAMTAVSLYAIALRQRYTLRTAWIGAFLFGTATLALPYSRWFFREPLMAFFALWAFALAYEIRQRLSQRQPVTRLVAALAVSTLAMILTKQTGLLFIPGLLVCLTPPRSALRRYLPLIGLLLAGIALFLLAAVIIQPDFGDNRYDILRWLNPANLSLGDMAESILGYQISPARSFWLYSPLLLLGFIGAARLLQREAWPLVVGVGLTLVLTSAAYGALRLGTFWNGGWGWGPRYMLPLVPLWMLFLLPVIESLRHAKRWQQIGFIGIAAASIAIQIIGIAVPYTDFYNLFYLNETPESRWLAENWSWQNTAIAYHLRHFSLAGFDSAWRYAAPLHLIPLYLLGLFGAALIFSRFIARAKTAAPRAIAAGCIALPCLVIAGAGFSLAALRHDARYIGSRQDVYDLIQRLNSESERGDTVFLSGSEYMLQFMNWLKTGAYNITLPDDAALPVTPAEYDLLSGGLDAAAGIDTRRAIDWAIDRSSDVWLVMSPSAYDTSHPQWFRRYLSAAAYPSGRIAVSPFANAEGFATGADIVFRTDTSAPMTVFGGEFALESASIPQSPEFDAGDTVPFALRWMPLAPLTRDYQISIQVLNMDGILVAQRDSAPQNSAARTSTWETGAIYEDRYGIPLPAGIQTGEYRIFLVVYRLDTLERLLVPNAETGIPSDSLLLMRVRVR